MNTESMNLNTEQPMAAVVERIQRRFKDCRSPEAHEAIVRAELQDARLTQILALKRAANLPARAMAARSAECGMRSEEAKDIPAQWTAKRLAVGTVFSKKMGATVCLLGASRTGKTVMVVDLALQTIEQRMVSVRYFTLLELLLRFEHCRRESSGQSRSELLEELGDVGLLILDECDKGFGTEAEKRTVFALLDRRHRQYRDTLLVTHPPERAFQAWAGEELLERINEAGGMVRCEWKPLGSAERGAGSAE